MDISAKDYLLIIFGIIGTLILSIVFGNKLSNLGSFSLSDILILITIGISAIIYVVYKRIGEIDKDIEDIKTDYNKLNERLKIHNQLINLEARIIALEDKHGKRK